MTSRSLSFVFGVSVLPLMASCTISSQPDAAIPLQDEIDKTEIIMGDGQIGGEELEPYDFTWTQCTFQDGEWVTGLPVRETLEIRSDGQFELSQFSSSPDGGQTVITHVLNAQSLQRTELIQKVKTPDGTELGSARLNFSSAGFTIKAGDDEHPGGTISSNMYGGAYLGLPLSTVDYSGGAVALDAGMLAVQGTYRVEAFPMGVETIHLANASVDAQRVDVWWLHHESGDIYEPGPDSSGGRYWLLTTPQTDLPRVLAYKTDTYAIEFSPMTCNTKPSAQ